MWYENNIEKMWQYIKQHVIIAYIMLYNNLIYMNQRDDTLCDIYISKSKCELST